MSSLQKFHRRTNGGVPPTWPATAIGGGDVTYGFWLGDISSNKLVVAPKSTEQLSIQWGSYGSRRYTTSTTDGIANTNTLAGFGNSITSGHPAAYLAKNLTTGGYNTWYLPAKNELHTLYSNKSNTPFATANSFVGSYYWSSTERDALECYVVDFSTISGDPTNWTSKPNPRHVRAVRRSTI